MAESAFTDAAAELAQWLVLDAMQTAPALRLYLVAEARKLPAEPHAAKIALAGRWPALSDEERSLAFISARNVLRAVLDDCETGIARLDALIGEGGRG